MTTSQSGNVTIKFYKIVHGFDDNEQYFPITSEELHKAFYIAMNGGKALFKAGFFQNRGKDILRIVPDWHSACGWNKGHKMDSYDYAFVEPLNQSYLETLEKGKLVAEYIMSSKRTELLTQPAQFAYAEVMSQGLLESREKKEIDGGSALLADTFKITN